MAVTTYGASASPAQKTGACDSGELAGPPIERDEAEQLAASLKAIADPTRLQLLRLIEQAPKGEACVCDLTDALGLRQPTISHHLKVMTEAGLLHRERRGTWSWYSLNRDGLRSLREILRPADD
ncbi:helix-turn-helix transcriptional regulator [Streptomyces sp. A7024]|uniref:Helix-turn-helix transcriptional regulator n=1 Tax=Streptomyces coryli TaxID=1128680 RepID=A0A6G4U1Y2_9ACTN|nr:metalloregulator ArsR/SmtB family transcription factor [Streptomyces coryli]NGN65716.1 helix-turn-helix transcriptional regulator [Streptomyces coryli]